MKLLNTCLALSALIFAANPSLAQDRHSHEIGPVAEHGQLSISGTHLIDAHGQAIALSGVSLFWSNTGWHQERMWSAPVIDYFAKQWKISLVRAAMGADGLTDDAKGGYIQDPKANLERLDTVIKAATKDGLYVIIDWHSSHADQNTDAAVAFFKAMAHKYGHQNNIFYEIYNEPMNKVTWSADVKPYAETVISAIRAIDDHNIIIVGSPTWSQDADIAAKDPIKGYKNLTYTLHFYAGTHKDSLRAKAKAAMDNGLSVFVSEWGTVDASGNGAVATEETGKWVQFMKDNCLSNANWSVSDKAEGASIFKKGTDISHITDNDLTPSGLYVKSMIHDWKSVCK